MIPTDRLLVLASPALLPAILAGVHPACLPIALGWTGLLLVAALLDFLRLPPAGALEVRREAPATLSLARPAGISLRIRSRARIALRVEWRDTPPPRFRDLSAPGPADLPPGAEAEWSYTVVPFERGDHRFGPLHVRIRSPLGLAARRFVLEIPAAVRVLPDATPLAREGGLERRPGLRATGLRSLRQRGEGREFESLREYGPGDEFRWIDWKASARTGRLIARQFQAERNQTVMLLLDAGRNLAPRSGDLARLDHSVNAALCLAQLALEAGDQVGILAFSSEIRSFLPPRRGRRQRVRIAEALTPLRADPTEPDYAGAFAFLRGRVRRRSLVVLFTELVDPESNRILVSRLLTLLPRHLPLCLTLSDPEIDRAASLHPRAAPDPYRLALAREVREDRGRTAALLRGEGALVAEVPAERLSWAAIQRYLEVKERGLL